MMVAFDQWWLTRGPFELLEPMLKGKQRGKTMANWARLLTEPGANLPDLAANIALGQGDIPGLTADDVEHFTNHWLGEWFGETAEPILRNGLALGFAKAAEQGVPADVVMISGVTNFQVAIVEGAGQITIVVCAPSAPSDPDVAAGSDLGSVTIVAQVESGLSDEDAGGEVKVLEDVDDGQIVAVQLASRGFPVSE
jgi:hypothetical protein